MRGAALASTAEQLREAVARACPRPDDKWVVKSPQGFAARGRVLGRGPVLGEPQARWAERRMASGETLIFQPWLDVVREYGIVMEVAPGGAVEFHGVSDYQINGAGVGTGYILGRPPPTASTSLCASHISSASASTRKASGGRPGWTP